MIGPCPFCGCLLAQAIQPHEGLSAWYVECQNCLAQGPLETTEAKALEAWEFRESQHQRSN